MENAFMGTLSNVCSSQLPENSSGTLHGQEQCLRKHKGIAEHN